MLQAEVTNLVIGFDKGELVILSFSNQEECLFMEESYCNSNTDILQLDGLPIDSNACGTLECETCGMTFLTEENCYKHRHWGHENLTGHDYCCDDCIFKLREGAS